MGLKPVPPSTAVGPKQADAAGFLEMLKKLAALRGKIAGWEKIQGEKGVVGFTSLAFWL